MGGNDKFALFARCIPSHTSPRSPLQSRPLPPHACRRRYTGSPQYMPGGAAPLSYIPYPMTSKNLADVVSRVAAASSKAGRTAVPRVVAVSKTKPVEQLTECYDAGHRFFGENYVQARGRMEGGGGLCVRQQQQDDTKFFAFPVANQKTRHRR
jgi:hypothetical protein